MESQNRAFSLYFIGPHSSYIFHNADASLVKTNCNLIFMGHFHIFYLVYLPQKSKIANRWKLNCMRKTLCIYTLSLMFLFMMILDHLIALLRSSAAVTNIVQYFWHLLVRTTCIYIYWHLFLELTSLFLASWLFSFLCFSSFKEFCLQSWNSLSHC